MVVTQSAPFSGWKGMDPELIPKFKEGEREAVARDLLEAQGKFTYSDTVGRFEHPDSQVSLNMNSERCCISLSLIVIRKVVLMMKFSP